LNEFNYNFTFVLKLARKATVINNNAIVMDCIGNVFKIPLNFPVDYYNQTNTNQAEYIVPKYEVC
jgi:hypothetical protein